MSTVQSEIGSQALSRLIADLKGFEGRKAVVRELRKELRAPLPKVRQAVRAAAVSDLPSRNGLGAWVAKSTITVSTRLGAKSAGISLRGGRNSQRKRSDIRAIDAGKVRAPSWGHRGPGAWHVQTVKDGFFTKTITGDLENEWHMAAVRAVEHATEVIRNG